MKIIVVENNHEINIESKIYWKMEIIDENRIRRNNWVEKNIVKVKLEASFNWNVNLEFNINDTNAPPENPSPPAIKELKPMIL